MAQYDGSIRILTEISTKAAQQSLGTLAYTIKGTAKEISSLRSKMDALKGQKFYTDDYKELQSDLALAEKKLAELAAKQKEIPRSLSDLSTDKLKNKFELLNASLQKTQSEIDKVKSEMSSLDAKILEGGKSGIDVSKYEKEFERAFSRLHELREEETGIIKQANEVGNAFRLAEEIDKAVDITDQLQEKMQSLEEAGKAFTLGENTAQYATYERQIGYEQAAMEKMVSQYQELEKMGDPYARLSQSVSDLNKRLSSVLHPIESMKSAFASAVENMKARAAGIKATIINGIAHPFQTARKTASSAVTTIKELISGIASAVKKTGKAISSVTSILKKAASAMFGFGKSAKSSNNMLQSGFKNILKYGLGIRSFYALINKFRTAVKEGFGNLAQYSEPVNSALSSLKSSLTQLKNSLATAFAPILTAVAPALTALIDMVSRAATAVGMLIAALTGQKTFVKATKTQQGYADSLKGTSKAAKDANKQLSSLDKLNNLTTSDSGNGGGGGGGAGVGDMFETVDIPSKIKDLADMIKKAWEKADFTEIGALIGTKLKDALDNIPWDEIQETAAKVGKSLATLINGFVEVEGLGYTIGNTIAQAINTGLIGLESFAKNLHWDSVGKFVGDGVNGALENIKWETALSAAKYFGTGIANALNNFLETTDFTTVGKTLAEALNTAIQFVFSTGKTIKFELIGEKIADGINGFFKDFKVKKLANSINAWVKGALDAASALLKKTDFKMIGEKIGKFLSTIDFKGAIKKLGNVLWEAIKAAFNLLSGLFKTAPLEASLISAFALLKFTTIGKNFANNLSSSLTGAISSVMPGIIAAFGEFFVVSSTFEELTTGTDNFVLAIGKIAGAVAIAGAAMTAVFGFPAGLIAAAIVGVTGAIAGTTTALNEMEQQMKEEEEISKYGQTLSDMADEIDRNSEAIKNRIAESENYIKTAGVAEAQMAQDLSDRYFELADKENKTNEEMEEMHRLAGLLVEKMPELNEYYNEQTGLLDTTKQSVDNLIQSRLQEIKLNAIEEQLTQAYKDQAIALQDVEKAAAPVNDAQEKMNDLQEKLKDISDKTKLLQDYEDLGVKIQNCDGDTEDLLKKQQELWNELTNGNTTTFPTPEALQQELVDTQKELENVGEEYKNVIKEFTTADEAYEAVNGNIEHLTKMFTEGMTDSANKGIEGYNQTMGNDTSMQNTATQSARDIVKAFNEGQDAHSPSRKFEEAAKYSIEGFIQGINNNMPLALTTMSNFATKTVDTFKKIKKEFETKGKNIVSGIRSGILSSWPTFSDFWGKKKNSIINKFSDIKDKMSKVGKNIVNGIIAGIKSIWSTLASWAQKIKELFTISVSPAAGGGTTASSDAPANPAKTASPYAAKMSAFSAAPIPALATGTVIPPNREFLAVLGDQKHGTNIEAPLDTIKQAVREELGTLTSQNSSGNIELHLTVECEGYKLLQLIQKLDREQFARTQRPSFQI